jgi:hypothetical protein
MITYFDILPKELIELLFFTLKNKSILLSDVSDTLKIYYEEFITGVSNGYYTPDKVFKKINANDTYIDFIIKNIEYDAENIDVYSEEYKDKFQTEVFEFNDIIITTANRVEILNTIRYSINNIKEIYLSNYIRQNLKTFNITLLYIMLTKNNDYIYFKRYQSLMYPHKVKFYINKNWKYFWNNCIPDYGKDAVMYINLYRSNLNTTYYPIEL